MNSVLQYISQWNHHQNSGKLEKKINVVFFLLKHVDPEKVCISKALETGDSFDAKFVPWISFLAWSDEHQNRIHFLNVGEVFGVKKCEKYGWWHMELNHLHHKCFECANGPVAIIWNYILCNSPPHPKVWSLKWWCSNWKSLCCFLGW